MNSLIESLNVWGGRFMEFAPSLLWQSSLLMALVFAIDFFLRRKLRPAVRYTLWFVVFVKLLLPPSLALPTGVAWWLRAHDAPVTAPHVRTMMVSYQEPAAQFVPRPAPVAHLAPPPVRLSRDAWFLIASLSISVLLGAWALFRWWQIARCVRRTTAANDELSEMLAEARRLAGLRRNVRLQLTSDSMSPAVCGLFRPVVLLPESLVGKLTENQLRAVLLHELIHLKRRDVWVNCAQTLLQITYWWHPLLWFANARVRRVREEAVDDAVMFALNEEAEIYAPTLLEVAKLAFNRPLATLGLVGILESRNALRHRIERLLNFSAPGRVGVSVMSVICIAAFTALAVPMGEPPARPSSTDEISEANNLVTFHAKVNTEVFIRNLQARADETMHTTNDAPADILASILDGFGVDCTPPRNVTFNAATGQVALRNTPEALPVVDQVIRELNLPGGEHILNPPYGLKNVLIEAQFYLIRPDDFAKLGVHFIHQDEGVSPWWHLSPREFSDVQQQIRDLGVEKLSSPRVQTAHGIPASLFIGDGTNNIQLECVPYVRDDAVNLTVLARTTGNFAPDGKGWPDFAGHTNCAIFTRISLPNGDGAVLRAEHAGTRTDNELVVLLTAKTVELMRPKDKVPFLGDLPGIGRLFRSDSNDATNLTSFIFHFDKDATAQKLSKFAAEHNMEGETNQTLLMEKFLENAGVNVGPPNSFFYGAANGYLALRGKQEDVQKAAAALGLNRTAEQWLAEGKSLYEMGKLDRAEAALKQALNIKPDEQEALRYLNLAKERRQVQDKVDDQVPKFPNLYARSNTIYTSAARQKIYEKLNNITFDKISFPNLPLSEVVRKLHELTDQRDIDQQGINFVLNRSIPQAQPNSQPQAFDPRTGEPIASAASEDTDLGAVTIDLEPGLKDVRLRDVLEAIVKSSTHPIKYSILDYGIEFSLKGPDIPELHTRTFKLDPNTFFMGLQHVSAMSTTSPASSATNGVGQGRGLRYVTGLDSNTEIQLAVINFFNAIGVNLAAPKSVFFNDRQGTLMVHATDADLELIEQAINTLNIAPPEVTVKVRFIEADEGFLSSVFTNAAASTNIQLMGILTEPAFRPILKMLQKPDRATLLNEGEVTTLSGRQASFQVVDVKTVASGVSALVSNDGTNYNYVITNMNFGTTLDVVPQVTADGYTIQMTVTPSVTEFLGYDDPKDYVKYDDNLKHAQLPLPKYRSRQMTTSANVWDGQTLVLGNLSDESVVTEPNGAKLRQPYSDEKKKQLIILITPTIIDPAGNRVHSQDYYDSPVL